MKILIIEDDYQLAEAMSDYFDMKQAECDFAYNGKSGLNLALQQQTDVIILDVNMPKMNGYEVCSALREANVVTPVLMMTAYDTTEDQLAGFRSGVDDFVVKPSPMPVIWARLEALLGRNKSRCNVIKIDDLEINLEKHQVHRAGEPLVLTPVCWKLLVYLARNSPKVVSRAEIEAHIWEDDDVTVGHLNVHLSKLRKVIDKPFSTQLLHTRINIGVQICVDNGAYDV